jgi:hypothetical protein
LGLFISFKTLKEESRHTAVWVCTEASTVLRAGEAVIFFDYVRFEAFKAVTIKMATSGMSRSVALVRTDVSEELRASIIRVTKVGELGTMLAATSYG